MVGTSPSNAGGPGSIPGPGAKIPHASWPKNQNIKQKQYWNKFNKDLKKKKTAPYLPSTSSLLTERQINEFKLDTAGHHSQKKTAFDTHTENLFTHFTDPTQIPDSSLGHRPRQIFELHLQYLFYLGSSHKVGKFINMLMRPYLKFQP